MKALAIFFIKVSNGYQKHGRDCINRRNARSNRNRARGASETKRRLSCLRHRLQTYNQSKPLRDYRRLAASLQWHDDMRLPLRRARLLDPSNASARLPRAPRGLRRQFRKTRNHVSSIARGHYRFLDLLVARGRNHLSNRRGIFA